MHKNHKNPNHKNVNNNPQNMPVHFEKVLNVETACVIINCGINTSHKQWIFKKLFQ